MELTDQNKKTIDSKTYSQLLEGWRFAPIGDEWFQGATGDYWTLRMHELRNQPDGQNIHVNAGKNIGW